jgi:hypothetical protein
MAIKLTTLKQSKSFQGLIELIEALPRTKDGKTWKWGLMMGGDSEDPDSEVSMVRFVCGTKWNDYPVEMQQLARQVIFEICFGVACTALNYEEFEKFTASLGTAEKEFEGFKVKYLQNPNGDLVGMEADNGENSFEEFMRKRSG